MADNKLDYFKKKIIEILKAKEEAEVKPEVKKSLDAMEKVFSMFNGNPMGELEKAGYGVGTVRIWRGKKYKKVSANPTKWVRVYEKVDRGAKGSMTRLINKVDSCQSIEELLQFCMSNHALFKDANGVDLPIVDELRKAVDEKKNRLENGDTSSIRPEKKAKKPVDNPKTIGEASGKTYEQFKNDVEKIYPTKQPEEKPDEKKFVEYIKEQEQKEKNGEITDIQQVKIDEIIEKTVNKIVYDENKIKSMSKKKIETEIEKLKNTYGTDKTETQIKEELKPLLKDKAYDDPLYAYAVAVANNIGHRKNIKLLESALGNKKEEPEETEAEKHENRSKAMEGNQNAKKDGAPEEDEAVKKTKEEIKEVNSLLTKYVEDYNGPGAELRHIKRMTSADGVDSKARAKIKMVRAMEKMHDELTAKGYEVPDVPKDLLDKVNEFVEKHEGKSYWSIPWNDYKVISGINIKKFEEPFQKMLEPLFKKRNELRDLLPKEKEVTKIDVVPGISNQEHANLFTIAVNENSENKEYNNQLMYNGKPFETKGNYSDWGAKEILSEQYKVVKEVGMDFKAQAEYQWNEVNNNKDYYVSGWGIDSALKKLSEKKLAEIAKPSMTDEEFKKWLDNWLDEKPRTAYEMKQQIKRHVTNLAYEAKAKELLEQRQQAKQAIDDVDLPVDPKDMDEAKSIIGRKVNAIAGRGDSYGKSLYRAELKKMIENRIRNNPGLARAMLVYIKDYQKENNVTIFTPQNEIWKQLPKLNENAMNAVMNGEGETQGGQSGELYSGDGVTSVIEDKDAGRYQVFFSGKPDYDTRTLLKQNGFRWAPSIGAWQCYNTGNGERSLARVAEKLGWKKNS